MIPEQPLELPSKRGIRYILAVFCSGAFLIFTHFHLYLTVTGIILWVLALRRILPLASAKPGLGFFPRNPLKELSGNLEWPWIGSLVASAMILGLLGVSYQSYFAGAWLSTVLSLVSMGGILVFLESQSEVFWKNQTDPSSNWWKGVGPTALVFLFGSFFLFYRLNQWPNIMHGESCDTFEAAREFSFNLYNTPFTEGHGENPLFPAFLIGMVFKFLGATPLKASAVFAVVNTIGFLFFHAFLRFYLSKPSALAGALLYATSPWIVFMGRMPHMGSSILVALEAASLYFFAKALEKGRPSDFILFGTTLSLLQYTYLSSRFVLILFILMTLAYGAVRPRDFYVCKGSWALAWGSFLLWFLPSMVNNILSGWGWNPLGLGYWGQRMNQVSLIPSMIHSGDFHLFWHNLARSLWCLGVVSSVDSFFSLRYDPFLSPWETLCLSVGFAWCLWRFLKPATALLLLGFFGAFATVALTEDPTHPVRALAAAPFVFAIAGIGLDRLSRVIASPLGGSGRILSGLFLVLITAISVSWHYDSFFNRLPKSRLTWSTSFGDDVLAGKILSQYGPGWDKYIPDGYWGTKQVGAFDERPGRANYMLFNPQSTLPLEKTPEKGAVLLLTDELGRAFQDWIRFYYPDSTPKLFLNPFGDVQFRLWEISPGQVRKTPALKKRPPPGGLELVWYDSRNKKLGQWFMPTFFSKWIYWFNSTPESGPFPYEKVAYFEAKGRLYDPAGVPVALETAGEVEGILAGRKFHQGISDQPKQEIVQPPGGGWFPFRIRYKAKSWDASLKLLRHDPGGWVPIPPGDLKPCSGGEK